MHLTGRQKEFLRKLADIYRQRNRPVHYVDLASNLGVSKWTAYDIMNVLERKGMVTREYAIREGGTASGRSQVLFRPTDTGAAMLADLAGGRLDEQDWEEMKERILSAIERAPASEYQTVAEELLRALDSQGSLRGYWAAAMTALLLTVKNLRGSMEQIPLLREISTRVSSPRARLIALAEVVASLPRKGLRESDLQQKLREFIGSHEVLVELISGPQQETLLQFLGRAMKRVCGS